MRYYFLILFAAIFICGCATQSQMRKEFEIQEKEYSQKFERAKSPEEAIGVFKDYLQTVDQFQKRGCTAIRYAHVRGLTEARIAVIYQELGDNQASQIYMDKALADIHQDKDGKDENEASLKQAAETMESWNTPDWRKTPEH